MLRQTAIQEGSWYSQLLMRQWHSDQAQHLHQMVMCTVTLCLTAVQLVMYNRVSNTCMSASDFTVSFEAYWLVKRITAKLLSNQSCTDRYHAALCPPLIRCAGWTIPSNIWTFVWLH